MNNFPLPRLDKDDKLRNFLLNFCRVKSGDVWKDPLKKHKVACCNAEDKKSIKDLMGRNKASLAVHDPPYNMVAFQKMNADEFAKWCGIWIDNTEEILAENSALYVWLGADQKKHLEPFAEFILMMRNTAFDSRSFITMRNQRGYGTQMNWMSVRQELLYYTKGNPVFNIEEVYTDIPKILKGYYKEVNGIKTENLERSKSVNIRASNVWVDVQQVFHLLDENVNGCFAQKPLKAIERIIKVSSSENDRVVDFFAHAGTTLIGCERLKRKCITIDIDPIYCEIAIRRLEHLRETGHTGWQNSNPFAQEILDSKTIKNYLKKEYNIVYKVST